MPAANFDPLQWGAQNPYQNPYTSALGQQYLAGQLASVDTDEQAQEGQAWNEGDEGGLIGKFSTSGKIAGARSNAAATKAGIIGNYNMTAAAAQQNQQNQNMALEGEEFSGSELTQQENFQQMMAEQGWNQEQNMANFGRHQAEQGAFAGLGMGLLGQAASSYGPGGSADPFSNASDWIGGGGGGAAGGSIAGAIGGIF